MQGGIGFYTKVAHDIIAGKARLPTLPDVALRLRRATQDPDCDWDEIERIIQSDAGLSAHLIQLANSPLYRGWREVRDLRRALSLFGGDMTRNLCLAYSLRAMFRTREPRLKDLLRTLWTASARRAALSVVLAGQGRRISADRALLAGLLQEIGLPLLYVRLEGHPETLQDPDVLAELPVAFGPKVSLLLLQSWDFDEELQEVARSRYDWLRDPDDKPQLADLILLVNRHLLGLEHGPGSEPPPALDTLPAYQKLRPGPVTPRGTLQRLDEATEAVEMAATIAG